MVWHSNWEQHCHKSCRLKSSPENRTLNCFVHNDTPTRIKTPEEALKTNTNRGNESKPSPKKSPKTERKRKPDPHDSHYCNAHPTNLKSNTLHVVPLGRAILPLFFPINSLGNMPKKNNAETSHGASHCSKGELMVNASRKCQTMEADPEHSRILKKRGI